MLEWNSPAPACLHRGRLRVRRQVPLPLGRNGECAITRQPFRPILPFDAETIAEEQRAKTRTIDEEIALDALAGFHDQRLDVSACRILINAGDLAFDTLRPTPLGDS